MNTKHIAALLVLLGILKTNLLLSQEKPGVREITVDNTDEVICKDSLGRLLTYKEALALLKTGKYVNIPVMNQFMQIEHTIKKPNKEEKEKYQTYNSGGGVITTFGQKKLAMKYAVGDTIPAIKFDSDLKEHDALDQNEKRVLMFLRESTKWDDTEPFISSLLTSYPNISFIVCPDEGKKKLKYFFSESTIRSAKNLFLADGSYASSVGMNVFPTYALVDRAGKILFLIPPLPKKDIVFRAIKSYLDHNP